MSTTHKKYGVYCLANDDFIEWFQMFARSLRHFNPTLPLTVIPYNTKVERLKRLASQFHFDLVPESEAARFDALEARVMNQGRFAGMFRKWASFFGNYDEFIFLDADIAVTMPLDDFFVAFAKSAYDFIYFDLDLTHVYEQEYFAEMKAKYNSPIFNAGAFASRKGVITEELLWRTADAAAADRHKLKANSVDQPFLNYVFDTLPRHTAVFGALLPELAPMHWSTTPFHYDARLDRMLDTEGRQLPYIHWAGCHYPTMVRPEIFLQYRTMGMNGSERLCYYGDFYYRRGRRNLKNALLKFKPTASLVKLREKTKRA